MRALVGTDAALVKNLTLACLLRLEQKLYEALDAVEIDKVLGIKKLAPGTAHGVENVIKIGHRFARADGCRRWAVLREPGPNDGGLFQHDHFDAGQRRFADIGTVGVVGATDIVDVGADGGEHLGMGRIRPCDAARAQILRRA